MCSHSCASFLNLLCDKLVVVGKQDRQDDDDEELALKYVYTKETER